MLRHRPKGSKMPITGRHSGYICPMMEGSWRQATDVTRPWWMTTSIIHSYESKWHLPGPHKHCWVAHARYQEEKELHLFLRCVYQITHILNLLNNPLSYAIILHLEMEINWFPTVCQIPHSQALLEAACSICVHWMTKGSLLTRFWVVLRRQHSVLQILFREVA